MALRRISLVAALLLLATLLSSGTASAAPCVSLQTCYSKAQIQQFYDDVIGLVDNYSASVYKALPEPRWVFVNTGDVVATGCTGSANDQAYQYCPVDRTVYVGQESLWALYSTIGDAGAAAGIAHEWGHHVQRVSQVSGPTLRMEQQADCVAGAWLAYMDTQGVLEPDDVGDVNRLIPAIASAETPDRDHGTATERTEAFNDGISGGIQACSEYFPATPLVT